MPACAAVAIAIISLFHVLTSDQKVYPKQKDLDMNSSCTTEELKCKRLRKIPPPINLANTKYLHRYTCNISLLATELQ